MTSKRGFSLIEFMIVIALVALIAGLTIWGSRSFFGIVVRADIEKLYTVCIYLHQKAVSTHEEQILEFDFKNNSYSYDGGIHYLNSSVVYGFTEGLKGPPSAPHKLITKCSTFDYDRVAFYPDGVIQSGTLYLTDVSKKTVCALTCGVGQISFFRKYRYDTSWHIF